MAKQKVLIVGGGFGGVKIALDLCENNQFDITLVSDHSDFRYYPALYRTAAGGKRILSSIPLDKLFHQKNIALIQDSVIAIDRDNKQVSTIKGMLLGYDIIVFALGVRTNYFGIKGLEKFSYGIKNNHQTEELKQHLHAQLIADERMDSNYVVIGGGPTGIEVAGAMAGYLKRIARRHKVRYRKIHIELVEAAPRLVPKMPKDFSRAVAKRLRKLGVKLYLGTTVKAQTADNLMLNDRRISSHTVVWTAGVNNHPFFADQGFQLSENGKVRVNQFLEAEAGIYVIGDNADTPYSGLAQTAIHDGRYVAKSLLDIARDQERRPYDPKKPFVVIPVGDYWAAVMHGKLRIYGVLGWALRRLADLVGYHDYEPWVVASQRWKYEAQEEESCPVCSQ